MGQTSRRSFITGTLTAGIAAGAVLGTTGMAFADEAAGTIPTTWDKEVDVLCIGSACGMAAAIKAAEAGCDTLVIEKADHVGGLWMAAGGGCTMGGGNIVQERAGEVDDVDTWFADEMFSNHNRGDADIMRTLCERGAETVQWMEDLGIVWGDLTNGFLRKPVKRDLWPVENPGVYTGGWGTTPNAGLCWTQVWENRLKELGVPILLKHRMTKLYRVPGGPVVGAEVDADGQVINIKARQGIVVATGSWTDNDHMVKMFDPRAAGENCYDDGGIPADGTVFIESTGDGQIAIDEVGGILTDMSFVSYLWVWFGQKSFWSWGEEPLDWYDNSGWARGVTLGTNPLFENGIIVKNDGKRFFNENTGVSGSMFQIDETEERIDGTDAASVIAAQAALGGMGDHFENPEISKFVDSYLELPQPRNVWAIVDAPMAEAIKWPIEEMANPNPRTGSLFDPECVAIADTLEELAEKTGLPADELKATIEAYNGYVDSGEDPEFSRKTMPAKIETGPFYAARASLIRHTNRNGVRVNSKSQVIDGTAQRNVTIVSCNDEPIIPHLYCCGECGNILGFRRIHNSLGHYATAAMIAGENVALEEPVA